MRERSTNVTCVFERGTPNAITPGLNTNDNDDDNDNINGGDDHSHT